MHAVAHAHVQRLRSKHHLSKFLLLNGKCTASTAHTSCPQAPHVCITLSMFFAARGNANTSQCLSSSLALAMFHSTARVTPSLLGGDRLCLIPVLACPGSSQFVVRHPS